MRLDFTTWLLLLFPTVLLLAPDLYRFYLDQNVAISFSTLGELWQEYSKNTYQSIRGNWGAIDFILGLKAFLIGGTLTITGLIFVSSEASRKPNAESKNPISRVTQTNNMIINTKENRLYYADMR